MSKNTGRLLLIAAAVLLVSLAFQGRAQAFAEPCPAGYTGPESLQFGCCFHLKPPGPSTLAYYEYFCVDGVRVGSSTQVCSAQPCKL